MIHNCVWGAMRRWRRRQLMPALLALLVAACATPLARQARYTGALAGCGAAQTSTLTRVAERGGNGSFAFAPADGSLIVRGTVAPDGTLRGSLNTQPPGKPPFMLQVQGLAGTETADVTYITPTCRAEAHLRRVPTRILP